MVRIGNLVVDLDQCALREFSESPCIEVYYLSRCFTFTKQSDPAEYRALKAYMAKQTALDIYNLQQVRDENFNPFMDELASTLFSVFQSLPQSEDMVLSLLADGQGGIWWAKEQDQRIENALVRWRSSDEALDKLQAFRNPLVK